MTRQHERHGLRGTRLYNIWKGMRQRCTYPDHVKWARYGGRGIRITPEWTQFSAFHQWAMTNGYEDGLTLDRIDGEGDYEPDNCRWATPKEQAANSSIPVLVTAFGETKNISDWSKDPRCSPGLNRRQLAYRIRSYGWEAERAITTPLRAGYRRIIIDNNVDTVSDDDTKGQGQDHG